jgi:hypothetical protein
MKNENSKIQYSYCNQSIDIRFDFHYTTAFSPFFQKNKLISKSARIAMMNTLPTLLKQSFKLIPQKNQSKVLLKILNALFKEAI